MTTDDGAAARIPKDLWQRARASGSPRVVALGVAWRGEEILVERFRGEPGGVPLHRPPGGGVRFGERAADALARELDEELDERVHVGPLITVLEDLFTHEGHPGHEVVLVFEMRFADPRTYQRARFTARDHGDVDVPLRWVPVSELSDDGPLPLCPRGLTDILRRWRAGDGSPTRGEHP